MESSSLFKTHFGAFPSEEGVAFSVAAPEAKKVELVLYDEDGKTEKQTVPLNHIASQGVWRSIVKEAKTGTLYKYKIDGSGPFPDPASRFQPEGIHGPSLVVDPSKFQWHDQNWKGVEQVEKIVIYELHVGTFTAEGNYKGVQDKLSYLKNELGITAIEILPIADFPGRWNWGYDGVDLYAPTRAYGTPDELRALVDAAHSVGLYVFLDVVYNHLGPDGNYHSCFNPHFFTKKHSTPWGQALNIDKSVTKGESDKELLSDTKYAHLVREFLIDNALYWVNDFHFDGFRLDATHALVDDSEPHLLQELVVTCNSSANKKGNRIVFFGEDERNDTKLLRQPPSGYGLHSLWADDFHHQVRVMMAGDHESYFQDFSGSTKDIVETIKKGWFYVGQKSKNTGHNRGTETNDIPNLTQFCVCIQNHDQIGNRAMGERLNHQITPSAFKVASGLMLLVPETPMIFQGQEFAASTPFQYFTDHNAELGKLVTEGRRKEFSKFEAFNDPKTREKIPDPQSEKTFQNSKLNWGEYKEGVHGAVLRFYKALLQLRLSEPAMLNCERTFFDAVAVDESTISLVRRAKSSDAPTIVAVLHFKEGAVTVPFDKVSPFVKDAASVEVVLTSEDAQFCEGSQSKPPKVEGKQINFEVPSLIVLKVPNSVSTQ